MKNQHSAESKHSTQSHAFPKSYYFQVLNTPEQRGQIGVQLPLLRSPLQFSNGVLEQQRRGPARKWAGHVWG